MLPFMTHVLFFIWKKKKTPQPIPKAPQSPMIPCTVTAELQAFLRNFNVKQKRETGRGQRSKITPRSLVSSACFLLTVPLARSGSCPAVCVNVCVRVRARAHIGLNKPRDAVRVTQLASIQPGLALPLLLQAFQRTTSVHFRC